MNNVQQTSHDPSEPLTILDRLRIEEKTVHNPNIPYGANVFEILGGWQQAAKREGRNDRPGKQWTAEEIKAVLDESRTGDYYHAMGVIEEFSRDEAEPFDEDDVYASPEVPVAKSLVFMNAKALNESHPDTFARPSDTELERLKPGDTVKIGVETPNASVTAERFWCIIQSIDGDPQTIHATVDNDLILTSEHGLRLGYPISFQHHHILSILSIYQ